MADRTKSTISRTRITKNHKSSRSMRKTASLIWAPGSLADGMQLLVFQLLYNMPVQGVAAVLLGLPNHLP